MDQKQTKELLEDLYRRLTAIDAVYTTQKITTFKPLVGSKGQNDFFKDQEANVRLVLGDNRSGKSVVGAVEAWAHSLGYRPWLSKDDPLYIVRLSNGQPIPVPNIGRIIAQDFPQAIKQNIWEKLIEWAPRGWYTVRKNAQGVISEINWKNGSVIYLMADTQDDMAFEGTRGHWFWGDEPFGYKKYVALKRGLVDYSGHCWMTLTPLSQPWIADIIETRAGDPDGKVKSYRFSVYDNIKGEGGHVELEDIQNLRDDLRPDELAARMGGQWMHLTGVVYKQWKPEPPFWIEPFDIPVTWPRVCIIDPHPRKPIAVLWAAVNPDNQWYVYRELYDESLHTVADVAERIKELEGNEPIMARLIDSSSKENERTSGESVWTRFAREGIHTLPAPKRNAQAGYDAIHDALAIRNEWSEPRLMVFNTCPVTKQNFMRFTYETWDSSKQRDLKGERQSYLKHNDDMIDCIRYVFQSYLEYAGLARELKNYEPDPYERGIFSSDLKRPVPSYEDMY
jgi:hypothetical protein